MKKILSFSKNLIAGVALGTVIFWAATSFTGCVTGTTTPATVVQTPTGPVTNPAVTTYTPSPTILTASNITSGVIGAAGLVPVAQPWVSLAGILSTAIFTVLGAASGYYAQNKNTNQANAMLSAVVQGVESGLGKQAEPVADAVKQAIQDRATAAGVQAQLDTVVKKLT